MWAAHHEMKLKYLELEKRGKPTHPKTPLIPYNASDFLKLWENHPCLSKSFLTGNPASF